LPCCAPADDRRIVGGRGLRRPGRDLARAATPRRRLAERAGAAAGLTARGQGSYALGAEVRRTPGVRSVRRCALGARGARRVKANSWSRPAALRSQTAPSWPPAVGAGGARRNGEESELAGAEGFAALGEAGFAAVCPCLSAGLVRFSVEPMGGDDSQKLLPWRGIAILSGAQQTSGSFAKSNSNSKVSCSGGFNAPRSITPEARTFGLRYGTREEESAEVSQSMGDPIVRPAFCYPLRRAGRSSPPGSQLF